MDYGIYANKPTNKATLHRSSCGYYKNFIKQWTKNGNWSSFFGTRSGAISWLQAIAKNISAAAKTKRCKICRP